VAPTAALLASPRHPYTQRLVAAVPRLDSHDRAPLAALGGDPPDPARIPEGCAFHPRCPDATDLCRASRPELTAEPDGPCPAAELGGRRLAACHYAWEPARSQRASARRARRARRPGPAVE
jgi:oligopeptide/dipeptide ABC transporter ATP-binding protein